MVCGAEGGGVSRETAVGSAVPHRKPTLVYSLPAGEQLAVSPPSFHGVRDSHAPARGTSLYFAVLTNVDRCNCDHSYVE